MHEGSSQAACSRDALVWLLYVAIAGVQEVIYEIERGYELKLEGPSIPSSGCPRRVSGVCGARARAPTCV